MTRLLSVQSSEGSRPHLSTANGYGGSSLAKAALKSISVLLISSKTTGGQDRDGTTVCQLSVQVQVASRVSA